MNELKLVKEVNHTFRQENNRLLAQYTEMAKTVDEHKMNNFKGNESNLKLKKEISKLQKELAQAKEEKDIADFLLEFKVAFVIC